MGLREGSRQEARAGARRGFKREEGGGVVAHSWYESERQTLEAEGEEEGEEKWAEGVD